MLIIAFASLHASFPVTVIRHSVLCPDSSVGRAED